MTEHEKKLTAKICTWSKCEEPGVHYSTDVDEPRGSPLLHCTEHDRQYHNRLNEELARYDDSY